MRWTFPKSSWTGYFHNCAKGWRHSWESKILRQLHLLLGEQGNASRPRGKPRKETLSLQAEVSRSQVKQVNNERTSETAVAPPLFHLSYNNKKRATKLDFFFKKHFTLTKKDHTELRWGIDESVSTKFEVILQTVLAPPRDCQLSWQAPSVNTMTNILVFFDICEWKLQGRKTGNKQLTKVSKSFFPFLGWHSRTCSSQL